MDVRPKRRWYQFTVGGLLILTTLVSFPLGWFVHKRNKTWKEQWAADQFHKIIRDAEMSVRPQADGKPWKEVQTQFDRAGYQPLSKKHGEDQIEHRFLIRKNAWAASNGTQHQLIFNITVVHKTHVTGVDAGLVGLPNIPFQQAIRDELYPPRSAVGLCLAHSEVVESAKKFPILKEIEVTYDLIDDRRNWPDPETFGFHVLVELGKSAANDRSGRRMYFTVESGLDPPQDSSGQPMTQGFVPSFVLGVVRQCGASQWESFAP
jgi:hypothetical protein